MHLNSSKRLIRFLMTALTFLVLTGCGQGSDPQKVAGTPQPPSVGVLVDSPVSGISWKTSGGITGITNDLGEFEYFPLETVTFSIGDFVLGSVTGAPFITVVELTGSSNPLATAATNMLVFLQSLDEDGDPTNGITISAATAAMMSGISLDFAANDFASQFAMVISSIAGPNKVVVSVTSALDHFYTTYASMNGADTFNFAFPGYPPVGSGSEQYVLVFADEFESGNTPSPLKWSIETGYGPGNSGWGNNEWQQYTTDSQNVRVEDGNLVLSALCPVAPCGVRDGTVTSGKINTLNKFNFKYGKVVARIKPPVGKGAWPAFWALGANFPDVGWPHSGEIDFMEMNNSSSDERTTHSTLHWCEDSKQAPNACTFQGGWVYDSDHLTFTNSLGDAFHVWEADWNADRVTFSIDGIPYYEKAIDADNMDEFLKEFYLILNVAMGGTLGSGSEPPTGTETFPQTMLVDYVRVFQNMSGSSSSEFKLDFEAAPESYTFEDFEGGAATVIANPVSDGINSSSQVVRMLKFAGQDFGGSKLILPSPLNVPSDSKFTMKVWSPRQVPVLLKLEGETVVESSVTHSGSNWEELTFDFGDFSGSVEGLTLIFDLGETGDATGDPANWTFYYDDIMLMPPGSEPPVDITAPKLTAVSIASNNANPALATVGDVVTVSLIADEAIMTPAVLIGGTAANVTGAGTAWQASRTLTAADADGSVALSITYSDLLDNAGLVVTTVSDNSKVIVDATAPSVVINGAPATLTFSTFGPINLTFQFDEPVTGFDVNDIVVTNGLTSDFAIVDTDTYTAIVTPGGDGQLTINVAAGAASDAVGISSTMATEASVFIDSVNPTVSIEGEPASFTTTEAISITFQFSEPVSNFIRTDIQTSGGSAGEIMAINSATYTSNITPNGNGDLTITVRSGSVTDAVGNVNVNMAQVVVVNMLDADAPQLPVIIFSSNNTNDTAFALTDDVVTITMTANEDIIEPVVSIGGLPATISDAGDSTATTWQASRVMLATDTEGEIPFVINFEDVGGIAGSPRTISTDSSSVTFDITAPTLSIDGVPEPVETLDSIALTFQFSEAVSGFDVGDIVVTNGTLSDFAGDAATYTANVTPDDSGVAPITLNISVADNVAIDPAGNNNTGGTATGTLELLPFWRQIWSDEFDGTSLNLGNWAPRTSGECPGSCAGQQTYSGANVSVANGVLSILATDSVAGGGSLYTSGLIDTRGTLEFKYGRVEIDAKMPAAAGSEPSLWLLPAPAALPALDGVYGPWPLSGEIDIVNAPDLDMNSNLQHTLRYGLPEPEDTTTTGNTAFTSDGLFHTYTMEWEAGEIRWFVDGVHIVTQQQDSWYAYSQNDDGVYTTGPDPAPFDQNFYLLISLAVGDNAGAGAFSQQLEIDAVRVYNCAYGDSETGTGCSTGTGITPTVAQYTAPYVETLEVYTDAPATLDFVDESGSTTAGQLEFESFTSVAGVTVASTIDVVEPNTNVIWNVDISAAGGTGGVFVQAAGLGPPVGFFDLSGGETAGELLFKMRVNSTPDTPQLVVRLDTDTGSGGHALSYTADGQWRSYSVKINDLVTDSVMQGSALNLANVVNLFKLEATGGSINLDLDDIEVKVACRVDDGTCQTTPRSVLIEVELYSENFESIVDPEDPTALNDWLVFGNVFNGITGNYMYGYGPNVAPNRTGGFSNVADDQGGPGQGMRQLVIFNDYQNGNEHNAGNIVEANFFHECTISANDVGAFYTFSFDAKLGDIVAPSTALAFIKTLDPASGFVTTNLVSIDTTALPQEWMNYQISLELTADLENQLVQFGFTNTATNFDPSGIVYDNIRLVTTQLNPDACP